MSFLVRRRIYVLINGLIDCRWNSFIFFCRIDSTWLGLALVRRFGAPTEQYILCRVNNYICIVCSFVDSHRWCCAVGKLVVSVAGSRQQQLFNKFANDAAGVDKLSKLALVFIRTDMPSAKMNFPQKTDENVENRIENDLTENWIVTFIFPCIDFYSKMPTYMLHIQYLVMFNRSSDRWRRKEREKKKQ